MVRKVIISYILIFILLLLQTAEFLKIGLIKPDLILSFIIYISLTSPFIFSETLAFLSGIILDIISFSLLGINAFSFTIMTLVLDNFKTKIFIEKTISVFLVVLLSSLFYRILYFILNTIFVLKFNIIKAFLKIAIPEALYTAIVAMLFFPFLNYIYNKR